MLEIPEDVLDEVIDAIEATMTQDVDAAAFKKLNAAWVRLSEAMDDARATEP